MTPEYFQYLIYGMTALAVVVFISLYFVTAGYGQFRTRQWGWSINNKVAWTLMEAPVFVTMLAIWWTSGHSLHVPELLLFLLFELHYFQRSFVFPWLMTGKSRMPVAIMLMGITFNVINGVMQGGGLFWYPNPDFAEGSAYLLRWNAIVGIALFIIGLAVNWHSDHVIRHLRQPGDTRHYLPQRGMYRYVTSANYLGELTEWVGFALAAIHKKYRTEFGDSAVGNRKRIIPFIY